ATEKRAVSPFQAIDLKGSMSLVVRQGAHEDLEVRADDNLLPLIETRVVAAGGVPTLEIGTKEGKNYVTRNRIVVTVTAVTLKSLALNGTGDAVADGLKVGGLMVGVNGSGDVQLPRLSAESLALALNGSGNAAI